MRYVFHYNPTGLFDATAIVYYSIKFCIFAITQHVVYIANPALCCAISQPLQQNIFRSGYKNKFRIGELCAIRFAPLGFQHTDTRLALIPYVLLGWVATSVIVSVIIGMLNKESLLINFGLEIDL